MLEKRQFFNGMNQDLEDRFIEAGEYRFALNLRTGNTDKDSFGSIENVRGNLIVSFNLPGGKNTSIGSYYDSSNKRVIWFVHNSQNNHTILQYLIETTSVQLILQSTLLSFNTDNLITGVDLIENDQLLYWTDGLNEPSVINIGRSVGNNYPFPFKRQYIDVIKVPPLCEPTVRYFTGTEEKRNSSNQLRGSTWQFAYRYLYPDNEKSSFSPISRVPFPSGYEVDVTGNKLGIEVNNGIEIDLLTGDEIVEKLEVAGRRGNLGDFFSIDVLDKDRLGLSSNAVFKFQFFNDGVYSSVPLLEADALQSFVPRAAGAQEYVDGNRLTWGDTLINFDIAATIQDMLDKGTNVVAVNKFPQIINSPNIFPTSFASFRIDPDVEGGNIFSATFEISYVSSLTPFTTSTITLTETVFAVAGDTDATIAAKFASQINQEQQDLVDSGTLPELQLNATSLGNEVSLFKIPFTTFVKLFPDFPDPDSVSAFAIATTIRSFKTGAWHPFGIIYEDPKGRLSTVLRIDAMDAFAEFYPLIDTNGNVDMLATIKHQPPDWAVAYQIVYAGNQATDKFIQFTTNGVTPKGGNKFEIKLEPITTFKDDNENSVLSYDFSTGDRIRFIAEDPSTFYTQSKDVEILKFDPGTFTITFEVTGINLVKGMLFELYTPKKTIGENLYFEMGECFDILNPFTATRRHQGKSQDQTTTLPALIEINEGDIYFKSRQMQKSGSQTITYLVEDFNLSDFYTSADYNKGRPNKVDESFKELRQPATIWFSEPFVPGTDINGLSTVFDLSFEEYDKTYGAIKKLYSENKRLLCFQELKVGAILVNEIIYRDLNENSAIGASESILSTIIYYSGEYGIGQHPESFAVYGNRKYFYDIARGAVLRLSQDGITAISDKRMYNYFVKRSKDMLDRDIKINVFGVFDKRFDEYVISLEEEVRLETTVNLTIEPGFQTLVLEDVTLFDQVAFNVSTITICYEENGEETCREVGVSQIKLDKSMVLNAFYFGVPSKVEIIGFNRVSLGFNERLKKWTSFYSYQPEFMERSGIDIVTFKDGQIYRHNAANTYNNFYSEQFDSQLHVVANELPSNKKFYKGIQIESNEKWDMPLGTTQANADQPLGQETNLIDDDFDNVEGFFYAALLKDSNTPNITNPLIEGDSMRNHSMTLQLRNKKTTFVKLFSVGIKQEESELSNR